MTLTDIISKITQYAKNVIVNDNSSSNAVKVRQNGTGNAMLIEKGNSVLQDGDMLIGTLTYIDGWDDEQNLIVAGGGDAGVTIVNASNTRTPIFSMVRTRGSVPGQWSNSVASGDNLGVINFSGADGAGRSSGARIAAQVDGTPGVNDMPGRLVFQTAADGSSSPQTRMVIKSGGGVGIGTTNPTNTLHVVGTLRVDGFLRLDSITVGNTASTGASPQPLPANPQGYIRVTINGTDRKIPFYNT
jgi:hypothetical protein